MQHKINNKDSLKEGATKKKKSLEEIEEVHYTIVCGKKFVWKNLS